MYEAIFNVAVVYILLCKRNIGSTTRHIFINIFQMERFRTVKFAMS